MGDIYDVYRTPQEVTLRKELVVEKLSSYAGDEDFVPAHPGDAGIDLYASEDVIIAKGGRTLVPTGVKIALPHGMEGQVRTKSGRALNDGLVVLNSPGTIDEGYRGEVKVILCNLGYDTITVKRGEKIAQLVIAKYERPPVVYGPVDDYESTRGADGFGSTGV